jgi:hypothetical protein
VRLIANNCDALFKLPMYNFGDDQAFQGSFEFDIYAAKALEMFKRVWTKPEKGREIVQQYSDSHNSLVYLSRIPMERDGILFWALPKPTIQSIIYYRWKDEIPESEALRQLVDSALREWFYWGPDIFFEKLNSYNIELLGLNIPQVHLTYIGLLTAHTAKFS